MKCRKRSITLVFICATAVLIGCFVFILTVFIPYSGYASRVKSDYMNAPEARNTEYRYTVKMFSYLVISNPGDVRYSENSATMLERPSWLYIYPTVFGENKYMVMFEYLEYELNDNEALNAEGKVSYEEVSIAALIDSEGNIISSGNDSEKKNEELISKNKSEIDTLLSLSKKCWGLNGFNDVFSSFTYEKRSLTLVGLLLLIVILLVFLFITKVYLWLTKRKIPFLAYCKNMIETPWLNKFDYEAQLDGKTLLTSSPRLFKREGALSVFENIEENKDELVHIQLLILTDCSNEPSYYVLSENVNISVFNTKKVKFEFYNGKIISDNSFVKNNSDKILLLIRAAKDFWADL